MEHFEAWAGELLLDNDERWRLEDFQLRFVEDVFRGFAECWLVVPESNGKTTLLAGLGLYGLRFASEPSIPIAASSMNQAKILYRQARGLIRRNHLETPRDGLWFEAYDGWKRIDLRRVNPRSKRGTILGSLEVYGADAGGGDGVIPYPFAFLDELHRQDLDLYQTWRGKLKKRGAQLVVISTAGAPGGEFEEAREKIRNTGARSSIGRTFVRAEGPGLVMHEHALKLGDDVTDLELVAEANPFSGVTVETLAEKRASLTMSESHWLRFTCNIAAQTEADAYIDPAAWDACRHDGLELAGAVCIGADGSRTWDTTVVAWATAFGETIDVDCRVFSVRESAPHHVLHRGGKIDFDDVEGFLLTLFEEFEPLETAYDPRYLERTMELVDVRLPPESVVAVEPASKHAKDAYQALFRAVTEGTLRHRGDPVLAAHLANCAVERDDRNQEIRRLRKIDPRKPIDAVPALAFAVWRATLAERVDALVAW